MIAFHKATLLGLTVSSAVAASSAHTLLDGAGLRSQVQARTRQECMPTERPRVQSKDADKTRFRFNLFDDYTDATCADADDIEYEFGGFEDVMDADECADLCVNYTPVDLANVLRGFNYDCPDMVCDCLYDEGTLDADYADGFDVTNYRERSRKGVGSISTSDDNDGWYCFKLVGMELTGEGLESYQEMRALLNSHAN